MEYQVFALKWRPQDFDEVVGQEHIISRLKNAILDKRLPHAFLFSGPHGVGKTSTARILAKSLNCEKGPTIKPCQKCSNCIEITESRSLDVIEIDGASNRGIDEIRALRENVKFAPTKSHFKIYIIDEVHMLTTEAFNALLKTLEEPPPFVKFIFATTQPHKVIPTILSRCQRFNFKRLSVNKIIEQLKKIIVEEKIDISEEILFSIAKASQGSLRDAESILDQLISFKREKLSVEDVMSVLGVIDVDILFSLTDIIIQKDPQGVIKFLNKVMQEGKDLGVVLSNLIEHFRNLLVAKISKEDFSLLDLPLEICQRLYQQSQAFSIEEIMHFFNTLVNIQEMTKKIDSLTIPLEVGLIKLCQEKSPTNRKIPEGKEAKYESLQEKNDAEDNLKQDSVSVVCQDESSAMNSITLDEIKNRWAEVIESLKQVKVYVANYLSEGIIREIKDNVLLISFAKNNLLHKEMLEKKENKSLIERTIEEIFKKKIKLSLILSKEEITPKPKEENPFVKSIIETFNARLIDNNDYIS
jgi:DNA polymerase-3 subunit gamma/tau